MDWRVEITIDATTRTDFVYGLGNMTFVASLRIVVRHYNRFPIYACAVLFEKSGSIYFESPQNAEGTYVYRTCEFSQSHNR